MTSFHSDPLAALRLQQGAKRPRRLRRTPALVNLAWVKAFAPKFQRFPDRPRFYSEIDVPSLPAPGVGR